MNTYTESHRNRESLMSMVEADRPSEKEIRMSQPQAEKDTLTKVLLVLVSILIIVMVFGATITIATNRLLAEVVLKLNVTPGDVLDQMEGTTAVLAELKNKVTQNSPIIASNMERVTLLEERTAAIERTLAASIEENARSQKNVMGAIESLTKLTKESALKHGHVEIEAEKKGDDGSG